MRRSDKSWTPKTGFWIGLDWTGLDSESLDFGNIDIIISIAKIATTAVVSTRNSNAHVHA